MRNRPCFQGWCGQSSPVRARSAPRSTEPLANPDGGAARHVMRGTMTRWKRLRHGERRSRATVSGVECHRRGEQMTPTAVDVERTARNRSFFQGRAGAMAHRLRRDRATRVTERPPTVPTPSPSASPSQATSRGTSPSPCEASVHLVSRASAVRAYGVETAGPRLQRPSAALAISRALRHTERDRHDPRPVHLVQAVRSGVRPGSTSWLCPAQVAGDVDPPAVC